ncbi:MAG: hypothetical protein ACRCX2_13655, partial [Paraclostridium sp.]
MSRFSISFTTKDETELHLIKSKFDKHQEETSKEHFLKILNFYNLNREKIINKQRIERSVLEKIHIRIVKGTVVQDYIVLNEQYPKNFILNTRDKDINIFIPEYIKYSIKEKAVECLITEPSVTIVILDRAGELVLSSNNAIIIFGLDLINIKKGDVEKMAREKERLNLSIYFDNAKAK